MYEMIFTSFDFHIYSLRHITFIVVLLSKKVADVIAVLSINNSFIGVHVCSQEIYNISLHFKLVLATYHYHAHGVKPLNTKISF